MSQKTKKLLLLLFVVAVCYFGWRGALFLDPDFGWHVQMGQLILRSGIPATDPFSYTMASYPVIGHEWLTDILFARGMDTIGYAGLAALFGLLAVLAFLLQFLTVSDKAKRFAPVLVLLVFLSVTGVVGIRPQILTWVFLSLVLFVVRDWGRFEKFGWLLPLVFVFWVNLHGGFALGIATLFLAISYWFYKKPAKRIMTLGIFVVCLGATFVTPYGYRNWWEVWMTMSDGNLRWSIQEWIPTIFVPSMPLWLFVVFSVMFVGRYLRRFTLLDVLLYACLLLAALSSIRHTPLWLLIALPLTIESIYFFYRDIEKIPFGVRRFMLMGKDFFVMSGLLLVMDLRGVGDALGIFGKQGTYPDHAILYLKTHLPTGQVFSLYDWGGYLIWDFPEKKVFIDGRMPSWRWSASNPQESNYAFEEYGKFLDGKIAFDKVINKYGIDTILLPVPGGPPNDPVQNMIIAFGKNVLHFPLREAAGSTKIVKSAKKAGWVVAYQDDVAVIYQKKIKPH